MLEILVVVDFVEVFEEQLINETGFVILTISAHDSRHVEAHPKGALLVGANAILLLAEARKLAVDRAATMLAVSAVLVLHHLLLEAAFGPRAIARTLAVLHWLSFLIKFIFVILNISLTRILHFGQP